MRKCITRNTRAAFPFLERGRCRLTCYYGRVAHINGPDPDAERERANLHALMSGEPRRFLPRPPEGWAGFNDGTDPNGVPWCPVDVPLGWECPRCRAVWAPSVLACHHCPVPPSFIAKGEDG